MNQTITLNGVKYETQTHDFKKMLSEIKIPKGWRLWTAEECIRLFNSHEKELNLSDCWFFIEHPFDKFKDKYVGGFGAYSVRAYLSCSGDAAGRHDALGVRFAKDLKVSNKKLDIDSFHKGVNEGLRLAQVKMSKFAKELN